MRKLQKKIAAVILIGAGMWFLFQKRKVVKA